MNLIELKELVDEAVEFVGEKEAENVEVRYASQPSWPFEYSIENDFVAGDDNTVFYLVENTQIGYLPSEIKDDIGW